MVVTLDDQFTPGAKAFTIVEIEHLCTAAEKNGQGVKNPCAALLCYKMKPVSKQPTFKSITGIFVADQFGSDPAHRQTSKACEVQASVGSSPTATASLTRQNAGDVSWDGPDVRCLATLVVVRRGSRCRAGSWP